MAKQDKNLSQGEDLSKTTQDAWTVSAAWVVGKVRSQFSETHEVLQVEWHEGATTLRVKWIIEPVASGDSVVDVRTVCRTND